MYMEAGVNNMSRSLTYKELIATGHTNVKLWDDHYSIYEYIGELYESGYVCVKVSTRNGYVPITAEAITYDYCGRYGYGVCVALPYGNSKVRLHYYIGKREVDT